MEFSFKNLNPEQELRVKELAKLIVFTESFVEIANAINHEHKRSKVTNYNRRAKSIVITGPSGAGKSSLVEWYRDEHPKSNVISDDGEVTKQPVLYISLPEDKNPKAAPNALLRALGDPPRKSSQSKSQLSDAAKELIIDTGVEVIVIDELHNAFRGGTIKDIERTAAWIKALINDTKRPIVLVGLKEECDKLLSLDSELETRFPGRFHMDFYSKSNFESWLSLLDSLDDKLPFEDKSDLANRELALRLLYCAEGRLSYLMERIIIPAAELAIFEDSKSVNINQMFEASKQFLRLPDDVNPLNIAMVPLSKLEKNKRFHINRS